LSEAAAPDPAIEKLLELLSRPGAPIAASTVANARDVHIADSLSPLELEPVRSAVRIADLGSGAGLPGLVIAARLRAARVDLVESIGRKCAFIREAITAMGLENAEVVCERSEEWAREGGREAYDVVTARALGRLAVIAELASPLLLQGGVLAAMKGARSAEEEAELARAAPRLALEPLEIRSVRPYPASHSRNIHLLRKNGPTPNGLPRRAGMAAKRPFGPEPLQPEPTG
jgi:16S rRNA (guanine527-N7)-methyltransferase